MGLSDVYEVYQEALAQTTQREVNTLLTNNVNRDLYWFYQAIDAALQGANLEQELTNAQQLTDGYLACVAGGGDQSDCALEIDSDYDGW